MNALRPLDFPRSSAPVTNPLPQLRSPSTTTASGAGSTPATAPLAQDGFETDPNGLAPDVLPTQPGFPQPGGERSLQNTLLGVFRAVATAFQALTSLVDRLFGGQGASPTPETPAAGGTSAPGQTPESPGSATAGPSSAPSSEGPRSPATGHSSKDPGARASDSKGHGSRAADHKGHGSRAADSKGHGSRAADSKGHGSRATDSKGHGSRATDHKGHGSGSSGRAHGGDGAKHSGRAGGASRVDDKHLTPKLRLVRDLALLAKKHGVPAELPIITALVESNLQNLPGGDRDSVGLFQQRAAWGSFAERHDPLKSARLFLEGGHGGQRGAVDFKSRFAKLGPSAYGAWAQAVQVSAFPGRYQTRLAEARRLLKEAGVKPGLE